ncbi:MAG: hypothetical protein ACP5XB_17365 [Isosphaeraceae bacterium]
MNNGALSVQILNDNVDWSQAVAIDPSTGHPWQLSTWYTFKFVVDPLGNDTDALFGKVWQSGSGEPGGWTIQEIQSGSQWRAPGVPALYAGANNNYYATADFKPITDTHMGAAGTMVWTFTPYLFSHVDSTRWQSEGGAWALAGPQSPGLGALDQTSSATGANKRAIFPLPASAPPAMMIEAEVTPAMSLSDSSMVGVGLDTDSSGNGYELAFVNDGGQLGVELREDQTVVWGPSNTDSRGYTLQTNTAYGMQLVVLQQADGSDTLLADVWQWYEDGGQHLGGRPGYWNMFASGLTLAAGSPSLDGGSGGTATADFANISVTAGVTPALPLLNMLGAGAGEVVNSTITGGNMFFQGGPWTITSNTCYGAMAGTYADGTFELRSGHERNISDNNVSQKDPYGKTVRLLGVGNSETWTSNDVLAGNTVTAGPASGTVTSSPGVGVYPWEWGWDTNSEAYGDTNQPEFIIFEGYDIAYEGCSYSVSSDGRELKIPYTQATDPSAGDTVSILSGPDAGQWFQIAQVMQSPSSPTGDLSYTFLMDAPLPLTSGSGYAISIADGIVNDRIGGAGPGQGNTIDLAGSTSTLFALGSCQFGTQVIGNHFTGDTFAAGSGGAGFLPTTYSPFTNPNNGGETSIPGNWTHYPAFGVQIDDNTFTDLGSMPLHFDQTLAVPGVNVSHDQYTRPNAGRLYFSGQIENNVFIYSNPPTTGNVTAFGVGTAYGEEGDSYELSLTALNNTTVVPASFGYSVQMEEEAGTINGTQITSPQYSNLNASPLPGVVNLAPYYNQVGLTPDNATAYGNLDGGGYSYSATALSGTGSISYDGQTFLLGPQQGIEGQHNVVQATGQTISVPSGNYTSIWLLGAAVQGAHSGQFTINYTGGSDPWTLTFSDWASPGSGDTIVAKMPYRNDATNNGEDGTTVYLYLYVLPILQGETVTSVVLPDVPDIKILAMDMYGPQQQLSLPFNTVGLTSDDNTNLGNLDGGGFSYSLNDLGGGDLTWQNTTFKLGPAGQDGAVSGGQGITVYPPSSSPPGAVATSLMVLATAVQGVQFDSFVVHYTDTTQESFYQYFSDWATYTVETNQSIVATMTYRNATVSGGNGRDTRTMYLYGYSFPIAAGEQVFSITLPTNPDIKVFAMNLVYGTTQGSPARSAGLTGPASNTGTTLGNMDPNSGSFSVQALGGSTIASGSSTFNPGSDGGNNVGQANAQTIILPQGNYTTLRFLSAAAETVGTGTNFMHDTDGPPNQVTQLLSTWFTDISEQTESVVKRMGYYSRGGYRCYRN